MAGYLIDVNLPRYFSLWEGEDFIFVADLDTSWADSRIWQYAADHSLVIVTKDADFTDRVLLSDEGPHVIHLRIGNMRMRAFHKFLTEIWDEICDLSEQHRLVQIYKDRIECVD